jgi:hypothetical protein
MVVVTDDDAAHAIRSLALPTAIPELGRPVFLINTIERGFCLFSVLPQRLSGSEGNPHSRGDIGMMLLLRGLIKG